MYDVLLKLHNVTMFTFIFKKINATNSNLSESTDRDKKISKPKPSTTPVSGVLRVSSQDHREGIPSSV